MSTKLAKAKPEKSQSVQHSPADKAKMATMPSLNAAVVIEAYQGNVVGKDIDMSELVSTLQDSFKASKDGDLGRLECMLIGQATALQTIFTSLARRATQQEHMKNYDTFLSLALKAQAQSRATIQAVVELKYPKQVAFVKQANISHGPQQVNNCTVQDTNGVIKPCAEKAHTRQSKLLDGGNDGCSEMDGRTAAAPGKQNARVGALESIDRTDERGR